MSNWCSFLLEMIKDLDKIAWQIYDNTNLQLDIKDKIKNEVTQMRLCKYVINYEKFSYIY